ncbi:hypothetical protein CEXT_350811 [Caerostris extrusa]|uniref:Uncharacterized protein n=1 Tax=Caerostris extrusa TaxID=172846 RepID=A0AAV4W040_CAEEX|nr:hypothetical protein CEXT_350811 [Caerostris extrusa]
MLCVPETDSVTKVDQVQTQFISIPNNRGEFPVWKIIETNRLIFHQRPIPSRRPLAYRQQDLPSLPQISQKGIKPPLHTVVSSDFKRRCVAD